MYVVLVAASEETVVIHEVHSPGQDLGSLRNTEVEVPRSALPGIIRERERAHDDGSAHRADSPESGATPHLGLRWVWSDTATWYPPLLAAGVTVTRCWDLRLCRTILRHSALTARTPLAAAPATVWDQPRVPAPSDGLFDLTPPITLDPIAEFARQHRALAAATGPNGEPESARLTLLLAAESAGALIAEEMTFAGVPWDTTEHDRLLAAVLGPRPVAGYRPALLEAKLVELREALGRDVNPDSPGELLKALRVAGLPATSTRSWELRRIDHPAITPLLEYKKLSRLMTANGWHWLDTWVKDGRFRPVYVPGGVVTGRWASDGGGALQLPHQVRSAVRADPGWLLVVADAAQLEPRILAAMSGDLAMATAGQAGDMYEGMVAAGAVETRQQAKYGMLGAMYGGTQGESGRMLPRITKAFPRALALVEEAARTGERGGTVSTWLGRTSPPPGLSWRSTQAEASDQDASGSDQDRARSQARAWGRFTRNFIVQGTAAEWALCWMALLRRRLRDLTTEIEYPTNDAHPVTAGPHLAFFLHDEIMVHTPSNLADHVATAIEDCAVEAGRLLFEHSPVEFRLTTAIVDSYDKAK